MELYLDNYHWIYSTMNCPELIVLIGRVYREYYDNLRLIVLVNMMRYLYFGLKTRLYHWAFFRLFLADNQSLFWSTKKSLFFSKRICNKDHFSAFLAGNHVLFWCQFSWLSAKKVKKVLDILFKIRLGYGSVFLPWCTANLGTYVIQMRSSRMIHFIGFASVVSL